MKSRLKGHWTLLSLNRVIISPCFMSLRYKMAFSLIWDTRLHEKTPKVGITHTDTNKLKRDALLFQYHKGIM